MLKNDSKIRAGRHGRLNEIIGLGPAKRKKAMLEYEDVARAYRGEPLCFFPIYPPILEISDHKRDLIIVRSCFQCSRLVLCLVIKTDLTVLLEEFETIDFIAFTTPATDIDMSKMLKGIGQHMGIPKSNIVVLGTSYSQTLPL